MGDATNRLTASAPIKGCNAAHGGVRVNKGARCRLMLSRRRAAVAGIDASWPRRHAVSGVGSVHESPKSLPSDMLRMLGLLHSLGLVVIPARSAERAHSCSAARRHRSRVAGCFILFAGLLPEQSDPRTREPRGDRKQARVLICRFPPALAGCRSGAILGRVRPPRIGRRPGAS